MVKGQTGRLPLHGWGHTGLLRGLSRLINSEVTVKDLSAPFLHLFSLHSGLPATCSPESARRDLPVLALSWHLSPPWYHPLVTQAGIHFPPHPFPSPTANTSLFAFCFDDLSNCCGKAEADLQHLLLRHVDNRDSSRDKAQPPQPLRAAAAIYRGHTDYQTQSTPQYISQGVTKGF